MPGPMGLPGPQGEPGSQAIVEVVTIVPDLVPTADATHPFPWFCEFDNTISLADGQQMLFKLDGTLRRTTNSSSYAGVTYRAVGDVTDGTILGSADLRQQLGFEFLVGQMFVSEPLVSDDYEVGICVKNEQLCPSNRDDGCPEYEAIVYNSKVTTIVLDLR